MTSLSLERIAQRPDVALWMARQKLNRLTAAWPEPDERQAHAIAQAAALVEQLEEIENAERSAQR